MSKKRAKIYLMKEITLASQLGLKYLSSLKITKRLNHTNIILCYTNTVQYDARWCGILDSHTLDVTSLQLTRKRFYRPTAHRIEVTVRKYDMKYMCMYTYL